MQHIKKKSKHSILFFLTECCCNTTAAMRDGQVCVNGKKTAGRSAETGINMHIGQTSCELCWHLSGKSERNPGKTADSAASNVILTHRFHVFWHNHGNCFTMVTIYPTWPCHWWYSFSFKTNLMETGCSLQCNQFQKCMGGLTGTR